MQIRYRRALPADVARAWPTVRHEWPLFPSDIRARVPGVIADLVAVGRLTMCVFEDSATGAPVTIGGYGCLPLDFLERAMCVNGRSVLEQAFESESRSAPLFMGHQQVAHANAAGELELMSFMATPRDAPDFRLMGSVVFDAWQFFVKGHHVHGMWHENASPHTTDTVLTIGYRQARRLVRATGEIVTLYRADVEPTSGPLSFVGSAMVAQEPMLAFSQAEQRLLEYALLDFTDQDAATFLGVTHEAIKKRWRAIHAKVADHLPALLAGQPSAIGRRRAILGHVRQHLEELRPFAESRRGRATTRSAPRPSSNLPRTGNSLTGTSR
jgi:hypothetical protein